MREFVYDNIDAVLTVLGWLWVVADIAVLAGVLWHAPMFESLFPYAELLAPRSLAGVAADMLSLTPMLLLFTIRDYRRAQMLQIGRS